MGDWNKTTSEEVPQRAEDGVRQHENTCVAPGRAGLLAGVMCAQNSFTQPQQDLEPGSQQDGSRWKGPLGKGLSPGFGGMALPALHTFPWPPSSRSPKEIPAPRRLPRPGRQKALSRHSQGLQLPDSTDSFPQHALPRAGSPPQESRDQQPILPALQPRPSHPDSPPSSPMVSPSAEPIGSLHCPYGGTPYRPFSTRPHQGSLLEAKSEPVPLVLKTLQRPDSARVMVDVLQSLM